jgi:predicted transposase YbfD/YdcC
VLCCLDPAAFQACFATWLDTLRSRAASGDDAMRRLLNVDGKTSRRSHDRAKRLGPLHSVSVWAADERMTLAQVACDEKSNEITAIPEILKLVPLEGAVVTIDAMGTQTAIAAQIVDGGGDYVLSLKGNQETIHRAVAERMDAAFEVDHAVEGARTHAVQEEGHGRRETRMYVQMPVPANLAGAARWKGLGSIGAAMLVCERDGRETCETRYFLSSLPVDIKLFARAVRGHWGIENTCHWSLDFTFREDQSRVRDRRSRENMAWLNRFALSLLQQHPGKHSLAMKRRSCGWDERFLLEVLAGKTG